MDLLQYHINLNFNPPTKSNIPKTTTGPFRDINTCPKRDSNLGLERLSKLEFEIWQVTPHGHHGRYKFGVIKHSKILRIAHTNKKVTTLQTMLLKLNGVWIYRMNE